MSEKAAQLDWLTRQIRGHLRRRPKRAALSDAAREAQALYEANVASLDPSPLACGPGCGGCCRAHVGVEPAEAFAILRHLRETLSADILAETLARVAERAAEVSAFDAAGRWAAQIPCAFLDPATEACAIYPARPLACRGYTSTDRAACDAATAKRDHAHPIPGDAERMLRARLLRQALARVTARLLDAEGQADHMELHAAITTAAAAESEVAWLHARKRRERR